MPTGIDPNWIVIVSPGLRRVTASTVEPRRHWATREHARVEVFWWLEAVYNRRRRHSSLAT
jgi:transposase InsO family protein